MDAKDIRLLIDTLADRIIAASDELTALDQAIGDGDHGINMKRGFEAAKAEAQAMAAGDLPAALHKLGMTLVMKIGSASRPLYGTLFMALARPCRRSRSRPVGERAGQRHRRRQGARQIGGRSKTMLDVLDPVYQALAAGVDAEGSGQRHGEAAKATIPLKATRGRASFLGERSIGHMDPGARSARSWWVRFSMPWSNGHDQQQCRHRHCLAFEGCGAGSGGDGASDGGAGGAAGPLRRRSGRRPWNQRRKHHGGDRGSLVGKGVAVLVDLGGAETNSEMAIEMLPADRRDRVVICNAPIVEGAVGGDRVVGRVEHRRGAQHGRRTLCRVDRPMSESSAARSVLMKHPVGLHARPSVKLTRLAKSFRCRIEWRSTPPDRGSMPRASSRSWR